MDDLSEMDDIAGFGLKPKPTAQRPLLGMTVLVVEDSRFASEALRLLCLRSGARIRRADSLEAAKRHLTVYRPTVAIVDIGLPDGSGLDLLAQLHGAQSRVPVLLGTSGNDPQTAEQEVLAAGADGFIAKPMESLAAFQAAITKHLPEDMRLNGPRRADTGKVHPDALAFREDLTHAISLIDQDSPPVGYLRPFLIGVARVAHDKGLEKRAAALQTGMPAQDWQALRSMLSDRVAQVASV